MYSAVLMLALTAGSESVDFGRHRCHGHDSGCSGAVAVGCSGGVAVGCSGPVDVCSGGGHGCHARQKLFGGHRHHRCHGCSAPVCCAPVSTGCSGYNGCSGGEIYGPGPVMNPGPGPKSMPGEPIPPPAPKKSVQTFAPATILVNVPAGARLSVDGTATTSTTENRTLVTPGLQVGATYVYSLHAEVVNNGQTVVQTQNVIVRGGSTSTVNFNFASQGVASR